MAIVAARVETQAEAEELVRALTQQAFPRECVTSFYVNPAGQHAIYPLGGDAAHDEGSKDTGKGAAAGLGFGALGGAVAGGVLAATAPVTAVGAVAIAAAGAAAGAYTGSLVSGLKAARQGDEQSATTEEPVSRKAGMLVAVAVASEAEREAALRVMRTRCALDIELAEGTIQGGNWTDFDPRIPPRLVEGQTSARGVAATITRGDEIKRH